jgi:hypothetical protein
MSEYLSNRKRNLNIGISSYTENNLVLDVIGNTNISGITSLASSGGITTTGGDLYVGGTIFLRNITLTPGTIETNYLNVSVASTLGIVSATSLIISGITTIGEVTIDPSGIITSTNPGVTTVTYYGDGSKLFGVKAFSVINQELTTDTVYPTFANNIGVSSIGISSEQFVFIPSTGSVGIGTTTPSAKLDVTGDVNVSGVITATTFIGNLTGTATTATNLSDAANITTGTISSDRLTGTYDINVSYATTAGIATYAINSGIATYAGTAGISTVTQGLTGTPDITVGIVTASTVYANLTGTATTATELETTRTFEITGDIVAAPQNFNGTQNVSLASSIQPNTVGLGTHTYGDYVKDITGTVGEIEVSVISGEGVSPQIGLPDNVTIGNNLTVTNDLQVNRNLNVTGNITIGGTTAFLIVNDFRVKDADIITGFTTDNNGNEVSNDTTANHGGISVASTEGTPLVSIYNPSIGEVTPSTYKKIMWFKANSFVGLNTDAWLINYGVGIGSTQIPSGVRLAVGGVQVTDYDIPIVRNINASGIITAPTFVGNLTGTATTATDVIGGIGSLSSLSVSGISTVGFLTASNINVSGAVTATTFYGNLTGGTADIATYATTAGIATYATSSGIATYATNSGISTDVIGGIGSLSSLSVSGVTTVGFLTASNISVSGIVTAPSFVGNLTGTATTATNLSDAANITTGTINSARLSGSYNINVSYATTAGISTYATSTGIATYAGTAGISTVAQGLTGTPNITVGIVTATTVYSNLTGTATTATDVIGGIGSLSSLSVSGISTVGFLTASNISVLGIVTASRFVGSATSLTNITIGIQSGGGNIGFAGTINFTGAGVSSVTVSAGIATINIPATVRTTSYTVAYEGQTIFPCSYTIGFIEVFFNGSKLSPTQYTANDGANVVLLESASANDVIETVGYNGFLKLAASKTILTEVSSNGLIFYTGKAAVGIATTEASWTIRRSLFSSAGIVTSTGIARNISWINRSTGIYT